MGAMEWGKGEAHSASRVRMDVTATEAHRTRGNVHAATVLRAVGTVPGHYFHGALEWGGGFT